MVLQVAEMPLQMAKQVRLRPEATGRLHSPRRTAPQAVRRLLLQLTGTPMQPEVQPTPADLHRRSPRTARRMRAAVMAGAPAAHQTTGAMHLPSA